MLAGRESASDVLAAGGSIELFRLGASIAGAVEGARYEGEAGEVRKFAGEELGLVVAAGALAAGPEWDGDDGVDRGRPVAEGLVHLLGHGRGDGGNALELEGADGCSGSAGVGEGRPQGFERGSVAITDEAPFPGAEGPTAWAAVSSGGFGLGKAGVAHVDAELAAADAAGREHSVEGTREDRRRAQR